MSLFRKTEVPEKFNFFTASTQELKDFVSDFAPDFEKWHRNQPIDERHVRNYILARPLLNRNWIYEKYNAWRKLYSKRKYAERKDIEALERTAPDEINEIL